jgi:uncharacterized protein YkwD
MGTLAVSAGFAVDRLIPVGQTTISVEAVPPATPDGTGSPVSPPTKAPEAATQKAPSLKPVRRVSASPRKVTKTAVPTRVFAPPTSAGTGGSKAEDVVIRLTNQERAKAGCPALRMDSRLRTAARLHSKDMATQNYFSHTSLDGDSFVDRIKQAGYPNPGAENIALGYQTAAAVMQGWMNSDGHRANILNCGLRAIGVGVFFGPKGPAWTQDFGWS